MKYEHREKIRIVAERIRENAELLAIAHLCHGQSVQGEMLDAVASDHDANIQAIVRNSAVVENILEKYHTTQPEPPTQPETVAPLDWEY